MKGILHPWRRDIPSEHSSCRDAARSLTRAAWLLRACFPCCGPLTGEGGGRCLHPTSLWFPYARAEVQSSPIHLRGLRKGFPLPAEMAPPPVLLLPAWGALVPGEGGRANCPVLMLTAPGASLQCVPPVSRQLPQDEGGRQGRQAGAGFSSQTHLYTPIFRRLPESTAGTCLAVATVLLGTRQKPLCAESQPERTP